MTLQESAPGYSGTIVSVAGTGESKTLTFPAQPGPIEMDRVLDCERQALAGLAKGRMRCLEVGTYLGGTAEVIANAMSQKGRLVCIDNYSEDIKIGRDYLVSYVLGRMEPHRNRFTLAIGDAATLAPSFADGYFDFIFIDGAHDYAGVKRDIASLLPKLSAKGILCGHDFDRLCTALTDAQIDQAKGEEYVTIKSPAFEGDERYRLRNAKGETIYGFQAHVGVYAALRETLPAIAFSENPECSIWWYRRGMKHGWEKGSA